MSSPQISFRSPLPFPFADPSSPRSEAGSPEMCFAKHHLHNEEALRMSVFWGVLICVSFLPLVMTLIIFYQAVRGPLPGPSFAQIRHPSPRNRGAGCYTYVRYVLHLHTAHHALVHIQ